MNKTRGKIMKIGKTEEDNVVTISLNDSRMDEVETYIRYPGVTITM